MPKKLVLFVLITVLFCGCTPSQNGPAQTLPEMPSEEGTVTTEPPVSEPPVSEPPVTEPPVTEPPVSEPPVVEPPVVEPSAAERMLSNMTLREKVGQLFIVYPESLVASQPGGSMAAVTSVSKLLTDGLAQYPVGGVTLFGANVIDPDQLSALTAGLSAAGKIPMFISVDEEGGRVARIANKDIFGVKTYASAAAVGASGNRTDGLEMGSTIGAYLKQYGFNLDFAPVGDVFTNPANTVIGNRAFSTNAGTAALMAEAMASGLKGQGIIPTYKHFPGHGDTAQDSHSQLAVSYKTLEEMMACEWLPFMQATDRDMVMVGHIACPTITGDMLPATLSPTMVTDHLRGTCDFDGLIITDAMNMGAITNTYGAGNAAVMAIQAGCDIILLPGDFPAAFQAVLTAAENGTISAQRLNESVLRILEYKIYYSIIGE